VRLFSSLQFVHFRVRRSNSVKRLGVCSHFTPVGQTEQRRFQSALE